MRKLFFQYWSSPFNTEIHPWILKLSNAKPFPWVLKLSLQAKIHPWILKLSLLCWNSPLNPEALPSVLKLILESWSSPFNAKKSPSKDSSFHSDAAPFRSNSILEEHRSSSNAEDIPAVSFVLQLFRVYTSKNKKIYIFFFVSISTRSISYWNISFN